MQELIKNEHKYIQEGKGSSFEKPKYDLQMEITPKAAEVVKLKLKETKHPEAGLRIAVKGGGCSGLRYDMALEDNPSQMDTIIESNGIKIYVDAKSYLYLMGTTIDYSENFMSSGLIIDNPNARATCDCGDSFAV